MSSTHFIDIIALCISIPSPQAVPSVRPRGNNHIDNPFECHAKTEIQQECLTALRTLVHNLMEILDLAWEANTKHNQKSTLEES